MTLKDRIGYIQGRLVDPVEGKIQAFPCARWKDEFPVAQRNALTLIEWTIDDYLLEENPFCTDDGRQEIRHFLNTFHLRIESVTGDCFMQAPFWKCSGDAQVKLLDKLDLVIHSCAELGGMLIVMPLVDNGRLENPRQSRDLYKLLIGRHAKLQKSKVRIAFESDDPPERLSQFIADYPEDCFGINYDIGNSASLGFDPAEEMAAYSHRISNVHIKDRILGGATVPLGRGAAQFNQVFSGLKNANYSGNFILQTARAEDGNHEQTLVRYKEWTLRQLELNFGS